MKCAKCEIELGQEFLKARNGKCYCYQCSAEYFHPTKPPEHKKKKRHKKKKKSIGEVMGTAKEAVSNLISNLGV